MVGNDFGEVVMDYNGSNSLNKLARLVGMLKRSAPTWEYIRHEADRIAQTRDKITGGRELTVQERDEALLFNAAFLHYAWSCSEMPVYVISDGLRKTFIRDKGLLSKISFSEISLPFNIMYVHVAPNVGALVALHRREEALGAVHTLGEGTRFLVEFISEGVDGDLYNSYCETWPEDINNIGGDWEVSVEDYMEGEKAADVYPFLVKNVIVPALVYMSSASSEATQHIIKSVGRTRVKLKNAMSRGAKPAKTKKYAKKLKYKLERYIVLGESIPDPDIERDKIIRAGMRPHYVRGHTSTYWVKKSTLNGNHYIAKKEREDAEPLFKIRKYKHGFWRCIEPGDPEPELKDVLPDAHNVN